MVWRDYLPATGRTASIAALGGWAVLVVDEERFDLVSNHGRPSAQAIDGANDWAYAARVGTTRGVIAGDDELSLRLDRGAPSSPLALATRSPAASASSPAGTAVAASSPEGVVVLTFTGEQPRRAVVPAEGERAHLALTMGDTVATGWLHEGSLELVALGPSGAVRARQSRAVRCTHCDDLSIAWAGERLVAAVGSTIVHTGGRANIVQLATWTPGGEITPVGPQLENRRNFRLGTVSGHIVAAWIDAEGAQFSLWDEALTAETTRITLTHEGATPEGLVMSTTDAWAWLSWIDGDRRTAVGIECGERLQPVRSDHNVPPGCDGPEDCEGRRCVVSALGGDYGCSNETCCGADECGNGCASNADCPPCRPTCAMAEGQTHGGCR